MQLKEILFLDDVNRPTTIYIDFDVSSICLNCFENHNNVKHEIFTLSPYFPISYTLSQGSNMGVTKKHSFKKNVPLIEQRGVKLSDFGVYPTPPLALSPKKIETDPTVPLIIMLQFS